MKSISRFITQRLKLRINDEKSAVGRPQERKFLGFTFTGGKEPNKRKISPKSLDSFKATVRQMTRRNRNESMETYIAELSRYLRGWKGYFGFCETPSVLKELDGWIRRRLRRIYWKQWKTYRNRKKELMKRGISEGIAHIVSWSSKGPWRMSQSPPVRIALSNNYFKKAGLIGLAS